MLRETLKLLTIPFYSGLFIYLLSAVGWQPGEMGFQMAFMYLGAPAAVATILTMAFIDERLS